MDAKYDKPNGKNSSTSCHPCFTPTILMCTIRYYIYMVRFFESVLKHMSVTIRFVFHVLQLQLIDLQYRTHVALINLH